MDWQKYERDKEYAGELNPSMLRRRIGHDYYSRRLYMITLVVEGRRPLLGTLIGRAEARRGDHDEPKVLLTELGRAVAREWKGIKDYYPEVEPVSLQIMPDHLHCILFVTEKMEKHLGVVIKGFKIGTNRHYRRLVLGLDGGEEAPATQSPDRGLPAGTEERKAARGEDTEGLEAEREGGVGGFETGIGENEGTPATQSQDRGLPAGIEGKGKDGKQGLLWCTGYNDHVLTGEGELKRWVDYLHNNPRRLAIKRAYPDYFRVQFGLTVAGQTYSAIGNRFLLSYPNKIQVQLSRSLTDEQIEEKVKYFLSCSSQGAVLVSPAISRGEQRVMRAALDAGYPLIFITPWGFNAFSKPGNAYYDACCAGRFLILAPWPHQNKRVALTRLMCMEMNTMTYSICRM